MEGWMRYLSIVLIATTIFRKYSLIKRKPHFLWLHILEFVCVSTWKAHSPHVSAVILLNSCLLTKVFFLRCPSEGFRQQPMFAANAACCITTAHWKKVAPQNPRIRERYFHSVLAKVPSKRAPLTECTLLQIGWKLGSFSTGYICWIK